VKSEEKKAVKELKVAVKNGLVSKTAAKEIIKEAKKSGTPLSQITKAFSKTDSPKKSSGKAQFENLMKDAFGKPPSKEEFKWHLGKK
jgi:transcriptional/translational regulatory protein YebC/TACO1